MVSQMFAPVVTPLLLLPPPDPPPPLAFSLDLSTVVTPPEPPDPPDPPDCLARSTSPVLLPLFNSPFSQISDLSLTRSVAWLGSVVPSFVSFGDASFAFRRSLTAVCRLFPGFNPVSTSTRSDSGFLIYFPSGYLICRFDNGIGRLIRWMCVHIVVTTVCMNALVVDKAFVAHLLCVLVTNLCPGYSFMEFDALSTLSLGGNTCVVGNKNFSRVVRRYTLSHSRVRAEGAGLKVVYSILDGRLIFLDHINGDSGLPYQQSCLLVLPLTKPRLLFTSRSACSFFLSVIIVPLLFPQVCSYSSLSDSSTLGIYWMSVESVALTSWNPGLALAISMILDTLGSPFVLSSGTFIALVRNFTAVCRFYFELALLEVSLLQIVKRYLLSFTVPVNLVHRGSRSPHLSFKELIILPNTSLVFSGIVIGSIVVKIVLLGAEARIVVQDFFRSAIADSLTLEALFPLHLVEPMSSPLSLSLYLSIVVFFSLPSYSITLLIFVVGVLALCCLLVCSIDGG